MFNIKTLRLMPGSTYTAKSGQKQPGVGLLDVVDQALVSLLGLNAPLSCCNPSTPTNGQILAWDDTLKKVKFINAPGGAGSTNIGATASPTGIALTSSSGTGATLTLATGTNAGLMTPAHFTALTTLVTRGLNAASPGNSYYYGTNGSGTFGYYTLPAANTGLALTEYDVTVSSSNIKVRVFGTAGITASKTNSTTMTFVIPAGGQLLMANVFYPQAEAPGANANVVFNYTSNTAFNQDLFTAKVPNLVAFSTAATPARIYNVRSAAGTADIAMDITTVTGGNITVALTIPNALQGVGAVYKYLFQ